MSVEDCYYAAATGKECSYSCDFCSLIHECLYCALKRRQDPSTTHGPAMLGQQHVPWDPHPVQHDSIFADNPVFQIDELEFSSEVDEEEELPPKNSRARSEGLEQQSEEDGLNEEDAESFEAGSTGFQIYEPDFLSEIEKQGEFPPEYSCAQSEQQNGEDSLNEETESFEAGSTGFQLYEPEFPSEIEKQGEFPPEDSRAQSERAEQQNEEKPGSFETHKENEPGQNGPRSKAQDEEHGDLESLFELDTGDAEASESRHELNTEEDEGDTAGQETLSSQLFSDVNTAACDCVKCDRPNHVENMVGCDKKCGENNGPWFHLSCAGLVVPPREEERWECPNCVNPKSRKYKKCRSFQKTPIPGRLEQTPKTAKKPSRDGKQGKDSWSDFEKQCVINLMRQIIQAKEECRATEVKWTVLSERLESVYSVDKTPGSVKNKWSRELRQSSQLDERKNPNPDKLQTSVMTKEQRKAARKKRKADDEAADETDLAPREKQEPSTPSKKRKAAFDPGEGHASIRRRRE